MRSTKDLPDTAQKILSSIIPGFDEILNDESSASELLNMIFYLNNANLSLEKYALLCLRHNQFTHLSDGIYLLKRNQLFSNTYTETKDNLCALLQHEDLPALIRLLAILDRKKNLTQNTFDGLKHFIFKNKNEAHNRQLSVKP